MTNFKPLVIHANEKSANAGSPGMGHRKFFDRAGHWAGWTGWIRNDAGDISDWHHHPTSDTYVYLIRGSLTIHFGTGGKDFVVANPGDFICIPAQMIHRETTGAECDLEAFIIRVGSEPEKVSVAGPEQP